MSDSDSLRGPTVRAAAVLIENNRILLVKQNVTATRHWSLPGGHLEFGETLGQCIGREMKEETGLNTNTRELLYITDRIIHDSHVVHISFLVNRLKKKSLPQIWNHFDQHSSESSEPLREIRMVLIDELTTYGFSKRWQQLVRDNFPGRGEYQGDFQTFYGEYD